MHSVPVHRLSDPLMHFAVSIRFSDDQGVVDDDGNKKSSTGRCTGGCSGVLYCMFCVSASWLVEFRYVSFVM